MAEQIVKIRTTLTSLDPVVDNPSWTHVYVAGVTLAPDQYSGVFDHENGFLNSVAAGAAHSLGYYISPVISRGGNAILMEMYDITAHLDGSPAGSPIAMKTQTLGDSGSGQALPEGVGIAIGYRADYGSDVEFGTGTRPRARDRNRTYIGPLDTVALDHDSVTEKSRVSTVCRGDCLYAMKALGQETLVGVVNINLQVWSRRNASTKDVKFIFADDRFDYQRRRSDPNPAGRIIISN
jgi:hypothetical protein